ncbi:hypothetical protein F8S09_14440 [Deinococcus sp. SDU3-2]|uniref:Uncharacterized protein n=1 Tax=Deinococcus terrestris TaxID=2651870 RepID=A0A7X1NY25_9DEIO|nr:hypothetical protein [Deinococcus terrestris]MPY67865.1 hypothetical protein [Deinococcus terrestris]
MRRWLWPLLLALLLCGPALATTYTLGAWTFTLPDGAEASTADGVRGYRVDGGLYIFTPPEPLAGRTLEAVAGATIADLTRGQKSTVERVRRETVDGTTLLAYVGGVTDPQTGAGLVHVYFFFGRDEQWGLALLMANGADSIDELMEPLATVRFRPESLAARQGGTETLVPKLPALPWATGRPDRTATSAAAVTYPAARKLGLDPRTDLLPDTFDCYFAGESGRRSVRTMTPTPDLRVQVAAGGTYAVNDGVTRTSGRWTQPRKAGETPTLSLEGPLSARETYVDGDDNGQSFEATHAASGRRVMCYQAGPRAEALRLELTRGRVGTEAMTCQEARGGPPFALTFGTGTYSTPKGGGRARLVLSGDTSTERWDGLAEFSGGPFDLHIGTMSEDEDGNRELRVTQTITENRAFYTGSTTTLLALCRAKGMPKPRLLYGRTPAPATGVSGGPDGLFVSLQNRPRMIGTLVMDWYELELSLFRPGGYHLAGLDPTELGLIPDCGRTRPNGDPFCERYTLKGNQLSFRDEDGTWEEAETYRKTEDGFLLGETRYVRVTPLTAAGLAGVYSTDDFSGNGPPGGALGGGVGLYNSLSNGYLFTPNGQFQWKYSSSSSTLISPNPVLGGVTGGGGSTRTDGGQGRYTLKDNWLTLTFGDGRVQRLYAYGQPAFFLKEDPSRGQQLNIGGSWLKRVGQP